MTKTTSAINYYSKGYRDRVKDYRIKRISDVICAYAKDFNMKICDVGCYGFLLLEELGKLKYRDLTGIDLIMQTPANPAIKFVQSDLEDSIKLPENTYDVIIFSHILEHLFDVDKSFKEGSRILKKGGLVIIGLPLDLSLLSRLRILVGYNIHNPFQSGSHIKYFKFREIKKYLLENGFEILETQFCSLRYGSYDEKFPFLIKLATFAPDIFSSECLIVCKKL